MDNYVGVCIFRVGSHRWGLEMGCVKAVAGAASEASETTANAIDLKTLATSERQNAHPETGEKSCAECPQPAEAPSSHRCIVVQSQGREVRLAVSWVEGIVELPIEAIRPLPFALEHANPRPPLWAIAVVDEQLVPLLDVSRVVSSE